MIDLRNGDCLEELKKMKDNSVDLILTDPPYHLTSITKRFGKEGSVKASTKNNDGSFARLTKGFMGKEWDGLGEDGIGIAFNVELWKEALRVLKHGGYLMAFSGTRTYHRMASAIEDAGFVIKDMISFNYGSGFPKALDISKALDKKLGAEREIIGRNPNSRENCDKSNTLYESGTVGKTAYITTPSSNIAKQYEGYKTALKPAHEPIVLAMKPIEGSFADNVMEYGTGGLNIDGTRIGNEKVITRGGDENTHKFFNGGFKEVNIEHEGRYPANFIISEDIAPILDEQSGFSKSSKINSKGGFSTGLYREEEKKGNSFVFNERGFNDCGGASRFFYNAKIENEDYIPFYYTAKCSKKERGENNNHPTVKPKSIMKYLAKLGIPPYDAVILDMFAGSGSTALAIEELNKETGRNHKTILIEREEEYCDIIRKRLIL